MDKPHFSETFTWKDAVKPLLDVQRTSEFQALEKARLARRRKSRKPRRGSK